MVEMQLSRIVIRETTDQQCVYLREKGGSREFPIVIGIFEAMAIDRRVRDRATQRPMTHDLLASIVRTLGASVRRIVIADLRDNTFFATIVLARTGGEDAAEDANVDARPSDAIALAVHLGAPIFVEEKVLETVLASPQGE